MGLGVLENLMGHIMYFIDHGSLSEDQPYNSPTNMRFSAIVPIAFSIAAFILGIHVLFAGRNDGFLSDAYIVGIDTSNLGGEATQGVVNSSASRLGLHDFYQAYVMNYCEGEHDFSNYEKITNCTGQTGMFTFDPVGIFERELSQGVTLQGLGVNTQDLDAAITALNVAYKTMFVAYCIGIGAAGIAILLGFLGFFESRLTACANWMFAVLSFLTLSIASGIGTAAAVKIRDAITREMGKVGARAYLSKKYLGMTWAAVICMLIVTFFWCGACFSPRKERRRYPRKEVDESQSVGITPVGEKRSWRRWRH
ncbi:hypothetical protein L873DRAFT_740308 [Choiromyces venosus 120613-1]|uniref:SUR7-domain-containing protein n=1 Tax=Choiromyces venosus 120613-1 TaxID=1336337 RepID=A0A3N4JU91_9PEZI|nr:hypothetical protein L873DRAFT_740308 [Choiromyces venosus 120613-1]